MQDTEMTLWTTPELIVVARSRPEETVLTICKILGNGLDGGAKCNNGIDGTCAEIVQS